MVYGGKPSTGCQNCRQRRIKCDEERPHCRACVRTGRTCPGYRHPLDVALRGQTAFRRKTKKPQKESPASNELSVTQWSAESSGSSSSPPEEVTEVVPSPASAKPSAPLPTISIPRSVVMPMENTVVPLFFNSFIFVPKDPQVNVGFLELLPQAYSQTKFGSALHFGLLAVSFFSVASWTGQRSLLFLAQSTFIKALRSTREALQRVDMDENINEALISVLLLDLFEDFTSRKDRKLPPRNHLRGAVALLNSRRPGELVSPSSRIITRAVQNTIIRTSLGPGHPTVPTTNTWPLIAPIFKTVSEQLQMAASGLVGLRLEWDALASRSLHSITEAETRSLLSKAQDLDTKLITWAHCVPPNWKPVPATIIPQSVRDAGVFQNRCECYSDVWVATTWNSYRDSRIMAQNIILNCLRMLPHASPSPSDSPQTKTQWSVARATISALTTDICASIPFLLGSQKESVGLNPYPHRIEYPEAQEKPVTAAHKQTAPLLGGWFVLAFLENLCVPGVGFGCLDGELLDWLRAQWQRILQIYTFGKGL